MFGQKIHDSIHVVVITPLPGRYRLYTQSDIYNPEGGARGIMNIIELCIDNARGKGVLLTVMMMIFDLLR